MGATWALAATLFAASLPIRFVGEGQLPIVTVVVDGPKGSSSFELLLDTGTTRTVLDPSVADVLGLERLNDVAVGTPGGPARFEQAVVEAVTLGTFQRGPLTVLVSDVSALARRDAGLRGVLGLDFLSTFHYVIDYEARSLRIGLPSESFAVGGTPIPYRRGERLILLRSENELWLALDTGAEGLMVAESAGLAVMRKPGELGRLESASGSLTVKTGSLARLGVGPVLLEDVDVTILPASSATHGLLPAHLFRKLYVNHREGYVVLDPP